MTSAGRQELIDSLSRIVTDQRTHLLRSVLSERTRYLTVVLEDIYYPQNASAVIRTCECLGLQEVHIIEQRHAYRLNPDVVRGAAKWIELHRHRDRTQDTTTACLARLRSRGYRIAAMVPEEGTVDLEALPVDQRLALCFGTEETGLSEAALRLADCRVGIPMNGFTHSYNLSVSAGISLYHLAGRIRASDADWRLQAEDAEQVYLDWLARSTPAGRMLRKRYLDRENAG